MPWKEASLMSQRLEFVTLAIAEGANMSRLCRRYTISRKTGYKWIDRFIKGGPEALKDQSRRPHASPNRTPVALEQEVLKVREAQITWGGRKIHRRLLDLGVTNPPAASTITAILRRHGYLNPNEAHKHQTYKRFEADEPNDLWQMDFKGHFSLQYGRCHPLTVLDDHSRFNVSLKACANETGNTVQTILIPVFRRYGLPRRILVDNGSPWGSDGDHPYTPLTAWLIRLGIKVVHSGSYHPQTLGKDERFHRTLKADVIAQQFLRDLDECQRRFDRFRYSYNFERPHESLDMQVPASRYRESCREYPEHLPPIEYGPGDFVRKVQIQGKIYFKGKEFKVGNAFRGYHVAVRPTVSDGIFDIYFCHQKVAEINLREYNEQ